jgi:hypothetical protein
MQIWFVGFEGLASQYMARLLSMVAHAAVL